MYIVVILDSATLRVLDVSCNHIGGNGMAVISEALQNNKSLTTLHVSTCGLSVKGNVVCGFNKINFRIEINMFSLERLTIGFNDIP